jgi:hypothetical protein
MGQLTLSLGFQNRDHSGRWAGDDGGRATMASLAVVLYGSLIASGMNST